MKNTVIYLFDVSTIQDPISGARTKRIDKKTKVLASIQLVGTNTYWQAQQAKVNIVATVELLKRSYRNQKYIYIKSSYNPSGVYIITNTAKALDAYNIKLNLIMNDNDDIREVIENEF